MSQPAENPFASKISLDENPFDDPQELSSTPYRNLEQREHDLAQREAELSAREQQLATRGKHNWPPFYPLIYHDIDVEIPQEHRALITRVYQLWLVLAATLILNMIACIFIFASGSRDGGSDLGASIGYVPFIGIASFLLWYRPIYNGYMKEQALYYYIYFFFCGWHLLFSLYMIVGIPSTGSAGIIQSISLFSRHHIASGILGIIASVGWTVQGVGNLIYYRMIWSHHNSQGHSLDKAKGELATHGAKSYFSRG